MPRHVLMFSWVSPGRAAAPAWRASPADATRTTHARASAGASWPYPFLTLFTGLAFLTSTPLTAQDDGISLDARSVGDGVYTEAQSQRGEARFRQSCASCHLLSDFSGDRFVREWLAPTLQGVFEYMRENMPEDDPGRLTRSQYADVLAYILRQNGFPTGLFELPGDSEALGEILVKPPPG